MPTPQEIYDELLRRGAFKADPNAAAIGHELRRRGVVRDITQGGRLSADPGSSSHDPYGDPADARPSPITAATAPVALSHAPAPAGRMPGPPPEAHTLVNFLAALVGANGKHGDIYNGARDLVGAGKTQGTFRKALTGAGHTALTLVRPLIPGNDNPLDLSAGQDTLDHAGEGAASDPLIANALRKVAGQKTHLGKDIFDHKLQTLADILPLAGAAGGALRGAAGLAEAAGAAKVTGGLTKAADAAHTVATLGPVGKAAGKVVTKGAGAVKGQVAKLRDYAAAPLPVKPVTKVAPVPPLPPEALPAEPVARVETEPVPPVTRNDTPVTRNDTPVPPDATPVEMPAEPSAPAPLVPAASPAEAAPAPAPKGLVPDFPVDQLQTDPERFQYKLGAGQGGQTGSLAGAPAFNQDLAGVVHAWHDPEDGLNYIVNGHNRHALATRAGQTRMDTRFLDAATAEDARTQGALINIAEGQGTALDAAKLFRDKKITPEELAAQGIAVKGEKARQGMALANLAPPLFGQVVRGELPVERAALIGEKLPQPSDQMALIAQIDKAQKSGRTLTNGQVSELADAVAAGPTITETHASLFGDETTTKSTALERAAAADYIRTHLGSEGRAFSGAARNADRLKKGNNVIDAETSARIAAENAQGKDLFDRLKNVQGPVSDILNRAAVRLAKGENANVVKSEALTEFQQSIPDLVKTGGAGHVAEPALDIEQPGGDGAGSLFAGEAGSAPEGGAARSDGGTVRPQPEAQSAVSGQPLAGPQEAVASEGAVTPPARAVTPPETPPAKEAVPSVTARLEAAEQAAKARLKARNTGRLNTGIDPENLADLAVIGAAKIAKGTIKFSAWAAEMVQEFGEAVRPHLQTLYKAARARHQATVESPSDAVGKLVSLIHQAGPVTEQTKALYHAERSRRLGAAMGAMGAGGERGARMALGQLKGALPKEAFDPIRPHLTDAEADELFDQIGQSEKVTGFGKITAVSGLQKLLNPDLAVAPTASELSILQSVYGKEFVRAVQSRRSLGTKVWQEFLSAANLPRTILSSFDISAPFRQGIVLTTSHPVLASRAFKGMLQSFKSDDFARKALSTIETRPGAELGERSGLFLSKYDNIGQDLSAREEAFASKLAERIPGIRASERAYVYYLNRLRSDVFDQAAAALQIAGKADSRTLEAYADFVNLATGRGHLGKFEGAAAELGNVFFSPRYTMSRFQVGGALIKGTPAARHLAARDLVRFVGAGVATMSLASLAGLKVGTNPDSPDFGKIRYKEETVDIWGGFSQTARFVYKMGKGMIGNASGRDPSKMGQGPVDTLGRFTRSKLSPQAGFAVDLATGKDFTGKPVSFHDPKTVWAEVGDHFIPMGPQDVRDAWKQDGPAVAAGAGALSLVGFGVQSYQPPAAKSGGPSGPPRPPRGSGPPHPPGIRRLSEYAR